MTSPRSDLIEENMAFMVKKGKFWLVCGAVFPVLLFGLELPSLFLNGHLTRRPPNDWIWFIVMLLVGAISTALVIWEIPQSMKKVARETASGIPLRIRGNRPDSYLYESLLKDYAPQERQIPGAHMFVGIQVMPVLIWAFFGSIINNFWFSLPFYVVGYVYLIWLWLTLDDRSGRLAAELGTIAENLTDARPA